MTRLLVLVLMLFLPSQLKAVDLEDVEADMESTLSESEGARAEAKAAEKRLKEEEQRRANAKAKAEAMTAQAREREKQAKREIAELDHATDKKRSERFAHEKETARLQAQIEAWNKKVAQTRQQFEIAQAEANDAQKIRDEALIQSQKMQAEVTAMNEKLAAAKAQLEKTKAEMEVAKANEIAAREQFEKAKAQHEVEMKKLSDRMARMQKATDVYKQKINDYNAEMARMKADLQKMTKDNELATQKAKKAKARAQASLLVLKKARTQYAARAQKLQGVHERAIASERKSHETAVSADREVRTLKGQEAPPPAAESAPQTNPADAGASH